MLRIGDKPIEFNLNRYSGLAFSFNESACTGKTTLLSFIEINNSWDWVYYLLQLRQELASTVQIIAVIFKNNASIGDTDINNKFPVSGGSERRFTKNDLTNTEGFVTLIEPDSTTISGIANKYREGFSNINDPLFHGNAGTSGWSYIISEQFLITDKWNTNCTINNDPVSLKLLKVGANSFNSADFEITSDYVIQRVLNLYNNPTISYTTPAMDTVISTISDLTPINVVFSKPMLNVEGTDMFTPGGEGGSSLVITALYTGANKVENMATLNISGTLRNGDVTITLSSSITDTAGVALSANEINYTADITPPRVISLRVNPTE